MPRLPRCHWRATVQGAVGLRWRGGSCRLTCSASPHLVTKTGERESSLMAEEVRAVPLVTKATSAFNPLPLISWVTIQFPNRFRDMLRKIAKIKLIQVVKSG